MQASASSVSVLAGTTNAWNLATTLGVSRKTKAASVPVFVDVARVDLVKDCVAVLNGSLNRHAIFRESRKSLLHNSYPSLTDFSFSKRFVRGHLLQFIVAHSARSKLGARPRSIGA